MEQIKRFSVENNSVTPESLEIGTKYSLQAPYTRGEYEGQIFEGEIEFLGTTPDSNGDPMFRFLYTKKPEHHDEVGGGSTYVTNKEGLQWVKNK